MTDAAQPTGDPLLPQILGADLSNSVERETVVSNGKGARALLTICVPCFRDDASPLIGRLSELPGADKCTLIVYDDGTADAGLTARLTTAIEAFPGPARLVSADRNRGRSHARNRLVSRAEADWILLLDADMLPDMAEFLSVYLASIAHQTQPSLIAGGFSLSQVQPRRDQKLHFAQAEASDCLSASERAVEPGRYVFTSNILVHRDVLTSVGFDEAFTGWGWEDVDWGLRVADHFPILHIDNPATHLGLDRDTDLVRKFGTSGQNFALLVEKHPVSADRMDLYKAASRLKHVPVIRPVARQMALARFLPLRLRLLALKVYRASAYSEYLSKNA